LLYPYLENFIQGSTAFQPLKMYQYTRSLSRTEVLWQKKKLFYATIRCLSQAVLCQEETRGEIVAREKRNSHCNKKNGTSERKSRLMGGLTQNVLYKLLCSVRTVSLNILLHLEILIFRPALPVSMLLRE